MQVAEVRPSPIAGLWYTGDPARLRTQITRYLDGAQLPDLSGRRVVALVAPHAGHRYSGRTAGHAFAAVRGQSPELVAVISPMHAPHPGSILTTAHRAYATPLGDIPVDRPAVQRLEQLLAGSGMNLTPVANDGEHSLEILLPFLQVALAQPFRLLPVMLRSQSPQAARQLGQALARAVEGVSVLLVASTDLSHFYPEGQADELDGEMLRRLASFIPEDLFAAEHSGKGFACGVAAVAAVLWAAREMGADSVAILHHSTSADETGDRTSVVGYGAAAVLKPV
jgi:AmmeMemoRadiSam system protein B